MNYQKNRGIYSFLLISFILIVILSMFFVSAATATAVSGGKGWRVDFGTFPIKLPWNSVIVNITNQNLSRNIFIPTRTLAEWDSFLNNLPRAVTHGDCVPKDKSSSCLSSWGSIDSKGNCTLPSNDYLASGTPCASGKYCNNVGVCGCAGNFGNSCTPKGKSPNCTSDYIYQCDGKTCSSGKDSSSGKCTLSGGGTGYCDKGACTEYACPSGYTCPNGNTPGSVCYPSGAQGSIDCAGKITPSRTCGNFAPKEKKCSANAGPSGDGQYACNGYGYCKGWSGAWNDGKGCGGCPFGTVSESFAISKPGSGTLTGCALKGNQGRNGFCTSYNAGVYSIWSSWNYSSTYTTNGCPGQKVLSAACHYDGSVCCAWQVFCWHPRCHVSLDQNWEIKP